MSILFFFQNMKFWNLKKKPPFIYQENQEGAFLKVFILLRTWHSEMRLDAYFCHVYEVMKTSGYIMETLNQKLFGVSFLCNHPGLFHWTMYLLDLDGRWDKNQTDIVEFKCTVKIASL